MENITNEALVEALDEATKLEAAEANGTISDEDQEFLDTIRDPFLTLLFGVPTLDEVRAEVVARGLVG